MYNKSVFSFVRQLTTRHCPHLLLKAVMLCGVFASAAPGDRRDR